MAEQKEKIELRQSLFWDVDPTKIDVDKNDRYVIERILDFGDEGELAWMNRYYPESTIRDVVVKSRVLLDKSRDFWSLVYSQWYDGNFFTNRRVA